MAAFGIDQALISEVVDILNECLNSNHCLVFLDLVPKLFFVLDFVPSQCFTQYRNERPIAGQKNTCKAQYFC